MNEVGQTHRRLSHSSAGLLLSCPRRYWHKIKETPYDPDYVDDQKALRLGKAFHTAMELCTHERAKFNLSLFSKAMEVEKVSNEQERGLVLAMCLKYLTLHERSGLKVAVCEIEIGDEDLIGYVDAVFVDPNGYWWIGDLKTAGKISPDLVSRLRRDPQLNLYSYYRGDIAEKLGLDPGKFVGMRYRVVLKCTLTIRKGERSIDYARRIEEKIEAFDIEIPFDLKTVKSVRKRMTKINETARELQDLEEEEGALQNFGSCFSYYRQCPWWLRCHGNQFTSRDLKLVSSKEMRKVYFKPKDEVAPKKDYDIFDYL